MNYKQRNKSYTVCHSGLDPESSIFLDSCWGISRTCRLDPTTGYGAGMAAFAVIKVEGIIPKVNEEYKCEGLFLNYGH